MRRGTNFVDVDLIEDDVGLEFALTLHFPRLNPEEAWDISEPVFIAMWTGEVNWK